MKKVTSLFTAAIMIVTLLFVPTQFAYAEGEIDDSVQMETPLVQESNLEEPETVSDENLNQVGEGVVDENGKAEGEEPPVVDPEPQPEPIVDPDKPDSLEKVTNLRTTYSDTGKITIRWDSVENATHYQISRSKTKTGTYTIRKKTKSLVYRNTGLPSATGYYYKVRAIYEKTLEDGTVSKVVGKWSGPVCRSTKPLKVRWGTNKLVNDLPYLKATWKTRRCSGYEVWVSKSKSFPLSDRRVIKVKANSKSINKLLNGKKYYVKVRAYTVFAGKTYNGAWSLIKSKKVKTTGLIGGDTEAIRYYKDGAGYSGSITLKGNPYYFKKGYLLGVSKTMYNKLKNAGSSTKYGIVLSKANHRVCVYKKNSDGDWHVVRYCRCSIGTAGTPTPSGTFKVILHRKTFGHPGSYSVWQATRFYKSYYFHSILYAWQSKSSIVDGRLGVNISHGCVRLAYSDAKFIKEHSPNGSRVIVY